MQRSFTTLILIVIIALLSNSGCGGNNVTLPVTDTNSINSPSGLINPTPTPALSVKPVQGYIYANNITTEDGEIIPNISVLDIPAYQSDESGNEPFITQVSNSLQKDYPGDWAKPEIQELYSQLNKTLSECKPLPQYNAQASVYSVYQDSSHETSIPVNSDGHFENNVLTGAADSTVKLEVDLGEDNYAEVETLPSSGDINSSDATGAVLKSCPEKIFAFPGEIVIFKIQAEPGINLKSAGLKFTLNNPSIGCITQPIYLCIFGSHKFQTGYGCLYVKNGLNTPIDSTITATTNSGLSLKIFTEVIKKTANLSGTVYTGGMPLVKGFVRSLGPKACCKIDENGTYSLPKVFLGHYRKVVCTYWTMENGKKVKHREEKVIDFFSQDMTGFNFGVPPTPTPTFTPSVTPTPRSMDDPFYTRKTFEVIDQFTEWKNVMSINDATQKTVDWLNGAVHEIPIPEGVTGGAVYNDFGPSPVIQVQFNDGMVKFFTTDNDWFGSYPNNDNIIITPDTNLLENQNKTNRISSLDKSSHKATCIQPGDIAIISPFEWQSTAPENITTDDIVNNLTEVGYNVHSKITHASDLTYVRRGDVFTESKWCNYYIFGAKNDDHVFLPGHYTHLVSENPCGLIYIYTHGGGNCLIIGPRVLVGEDLPHLDPNTDPTGTFLNDPEMAPYKLQANDPIENGFGSMYAPLLPYQRKLFPDLPPPNGKEDRIEVLFFGKKFLKHLNSNLNPDSIVYINSCHSAELNDVFPSKIYLGNDDFADVDWEKSIGYYFFHYMLYGAVPPVDVPGIPYGVLYPSPLPMTDPNQPMHVEQAIDALYTYKAIPDPQTYRDTTNTVGVILSKSDCKVTVITREGDSDEVYLPVNVPVTVHKK
jgi:hypothetical protein